MSSPGKIKAIVLTCDRWRAITRHLILKYERLWPDHPFIFHVPYQELRGTDTDRIKYHAAPEDIKGTILHLLADIDDEEWIYWCVDDKYPIELPTDKVASLISHAMRSPGIDGLLFCRCRALLSIPRITLHPHKIKNLFGDVYLERKTWNQIWIHQVMRAKVLRHLFKHLPDHIPSAKAMDDLKDEVPKLPEHRLFVTEKNYAVFGENCQIRSGCYVRENVIAGNGVVMGNSCEFKNCILFDEARVPHFNYVGDSILGHHAHLGAGVILSNVKLDHAEIAVLTPDGNIPTGLKKFGAIVGDRTEIGCNSVINPGSVIGRDCMIYPGVNFRGVLSNGSMVKLHQELQMIGKRET